MSRCEALDISGAFFIWQRIPDQESDRTDIFQKNISEIKLGKAREVAMTFRTIGKFRSILPFVFGPSFFALISCLKVFLMNLPSVGHQMYLPDRFLVSQ